MEITSTLYDQSKYLCGKNRKIIFRVMQYQPRPVEKGCDFRTSWVTDFYLVSDDTARFYLSVKPWRLLALQRRKSNIEIDICHNTSEELLYNLTIDDLLASSILCLYYPMPGEFRWLHNVLKRLCNMRKLSVYFGRNEVATSQQICRALNNLPRLRSLRVLKSAGVTGRRSQSSWSAAVLFGRLREGNIVMHPVDKLSTSTITLSYRALEIRLYGSVDDAYWTKYSHLYTGLVHFTVHPQCDLDVMPLMPPYLVSFAFHSSAALTFIPPTQLPQTRLIRLVLHAVQMPWDYVTIWCPNVCHMELADSTIEDPMTASLSSLTHIVLCGVRALCGTAFVRGMSMTTLHHLDVNLANKIMSRELKDWITNPQFLIGADVAWSVRKLKRMKSNKRAALCFLKGLSW